MCYKGEFRNKNNIVDWTKGLSNNKLVDQHVKKFVAAGMQGYKL